MKNEGISIADIAVPLNIVIMEYQKLYPICLYHNRKQKKINRLPLATVHSAVARSLQLRFYPSEIFGGRLISAGGFSSVETGVQFKHGEVQHELYPHFRVVSISGSIFRKETDKILA